MGLGERFVRFRSFWIYPALAIMLLTLAQRWEPQNSAQYFASLFTLGIGLWTLLEYGLHRFLFHIHVRNRVLQEVLSEPHHRHHAAPRDPDQILVHPAFGLTVSVILYAILYFICRTLFAPTAILTGIWTGFLYYELVHYRVHLSLSGSAVLQNQRRAHFYHHFSDARRNFGVTSPLWDYVFRTRFTHTSSRA